MAAPGSGSSRIPPAQLHPFDRRASLHLGGPNSYRSPPPPPRLSTTPTIRHWYPAPPTADEDCERLLRDDRIASYLRYETSNAAKAWRAAQWVIFFLLLAFIATIVGLMVHAFEQMQAIYDEFSSSESHAKLKAMLNNAASASTSLTAASTHVLEMAQRAHTTLDESVPVMTAALNRSASMVDSAEQLFGAPADDHFGGLSRESG